MKWREELAAELGPLRFHRVLSIEDDACDPKQAVSVANHVTGEQITLVDGHVCSGASIPTSAVCAEYNVLMMTPASVNSKLTDNAFAKGWPTFMRLYVCDDDQGKILGAWIADRYKDKKIAFVHDKSTYGKGLADEVKANLNAAGVQEILYEGINPGEKDYSAIVGKLKALGTEALYYGGYPTEGGLIMRQVPQGASIDPELTIWMRLSVLLRHSSCRRRDKALASSACPIQVRPAQALKHAIASS